MIKLPAVNRIEIIDHTETGEGRDYVKWEKEEFEVMYDLQDEGRTLKIFLRPFPKPERQADE